MRTLRKILIKGFKSIASAEIELRDLNVVIGANGSGKSNLIGVFRLLERVLSHNLQLYVASEPDRLLHHGRKVTKSLEVDLAFDSNAYGFKLVPAQDTLVFLSEHVEYSGLCTTANRSQPATRKASSKKPPSRTRTRYRRMSSQRFAG